MTERTGLPRATKLPRHSPHHPLIHSNCGYASGRDPEISTIPLDLVRLPRPRSPVEAKLRPLSRLGLRDHAAANPRNRGPRLLRPVFTLFPSLTALARAKEPEVLAAWSGLGYYRRARMMHQAAKVVVHEHQGIFPPPLRPYANSPESASTPPPPSPASPLANRSRWWTAMSSASSCVSSPSRITRTPRKVVS